MWLGVQEGEEAVSTYQLNAIAGAAALGAHHTLFPLLNTQQQAFKFNLSLKLLDCQWVVSCHCHWQAVELEVASDLALALQPTGAH